MSEWGIFFRLGIPGILMIAFEEWCLELSTFIAGESTIFLSLFNANFS